MAAAETEAETDDEEQPQYPWVNMTPTTRISGVVEDIFTTELGSDIEQPQNNLGLVVRDIEVVSGQAFVNEQKPENDTTRSLVDEDSSSPTDYRIADPSDEDANIVRGALTTGEKSTVDGERANIYDELTDALDEERVVVWFGGISAERLARVLDFNGQPFARFTDDGDYRYGLLQVVDEWRGADGSTRSRLKEENKGPRFIRPPILRDDVEDIPLLIDISRYNGGRTYEVHAFDAEAFDDEFGDRTTAVDSMERGQYNRLEADSELSMTYYDGDAATVIAAEDVPIFHYSGEGWQDVPSGWTWPADDSQTESTDASLDVDETDEEADTEALVADAVGALDGTDLTPEEGYDGGVEGLLERNGLPTDEETVADVRADIYSQSEHLDADDL